MEEGQRMTNDLHLEMNEYLPLRDVVFNTLRQAILRGELKPGERLMEIALSQRLGVSRTPVREAIRMLEQEGLVIMIPRKGAQVAEISEKDLKDVLEVRLGLEELAVRIACQRITEEELEELEQAMKEFEEAMKRDDLGALAAADVKVHEVIYGSTHNKRLVQIISNIREQIFLAGYIVPVFVPHHEHVIADRLDLQIIVEFYQTGNLRFRLIP